MTYFHFCRILRCTSMSSSCFWMMGSANSPLRLVISSGLSFFLSASGNNAKSILNILVLVIIGEYDYAANIAFASIFSTRAVSSASNIVSAGSVIILATILDGNISLLLLSCLTAALYPRRAHWSLSSISLH